MNLLERVFILSNWRNGIFISFLFFTLSFGRDFSYLALSIGGFPIYVTEICIILVVSVYYVEFCSSNHSRKVLNNPLTIPIIVFLLYGVVQFGFRTSHFSTDAFRSFAIVYYSVFAILSQTIINDEQDIKRIGRIIVWASIINSISSLLQGLNSTYSVTSFEAIRLGSSASGLYATFALIVLLFRPQNSPFSKINILLIAINIITIFFSAHRTFVFVWAIIIFMHILVRFLRPTMFNKINIGISFSTIMLGAVFSGAVLFAVPSVREMASRTVVKYLSLGNTEEANARTRLESWELSLSYISSENLLIGEGFKNERFSILQDLEHYPHNSFIVLLIKMGAIGLLLFLLAYVSFLLFLIKGIKSIRNTFLLNYILVFFYCQVATAVVAFFNVVLEGPFMGVFFWIFMGFGVRTMKLCRRLIVKNHINQRVMIIPNNFIPRVIIK